LEQLKAQPVEIIVLDVEMPVMDGVEFLRLLRHTHPAQRVVMLSGHPDETVRKSAIELGASLFLEKPTTPEGFRGLFAALEALVASGPQSGFRGVMQVGLQDVLQMECLGRKSSILAISTSNRSGQIYINDGAIVHAECGQLQGEMALYCLLGLSGGEFKLHPFAEPKRRTISGQHEFLLMEAARLHDENNSQSARPGSLGGGEQHATLGEGSVPLRRAASASRRRCCAPAPVKCFTSGNVNRSKRAWISSRNWKCRRWSFQRHPKWSIPSGVDGHRREPLANPNPTDLQAPGA
jgi:CheY-like chemotaxis protein